MGDGGPPARLQVHEGRLYSASEDGTVREWRLGGTWAPLRAVAVYGPDDGQVLPPGPCRARLSGRMRGLGIDHIATLPMRGCLGR